MVNTTQMMIKKLCTLKLHAVLFALVLAMMPSFATATSSEAHHWYVAIDTGWMQTETTKGIMTIPNGSNYPPPENVDQYSLHQTQSTLVDIQVGYRWHRDAKWIPSYALALRYEHVFNPTMTGMVTQYSDPEFRNYAYSWEISTDVVSLYSKFDFMKFKHLMLYIDLGIGLSFNQSHAYNETALPNIIARINPNYASSTNTQFAYNVGAGLDYILMQNFLISAGYSYQSFGNFSSGFGQGPNWENAQLKSGKINANIGFIGMAYLFK
jgi:opacity protein-like surface antigen